MLHHVFRGEGRNLVVLHGAGLDHRHMEVTVEPLFAAREGWRRIYLDLPGHGQSAAGMVRSQQDLLDAVVGFLDDLLPGEPFAIIGESRGSFIAGGIAYLRPERVDGMLLIVPGGNPDCDTGRIPAHEVLVPNPVLRNSLEERDQKALDRLVVQSASALQKVVQTKRPARALADEAVLKSTWEQYNFDFDLFAPEARFNKPCLIVVGRQDHMSGYHDGWDLMEIYTRASLAVLDTAGHAVAWERPGVFNALAQDWLDRMEVSSGD